MARLLAPRRFGTRFLTWWSAAPTAVVLVLALLVIANRRSPVFQPMDLWWYQVMLGTRMPGLTDVNIALNWLGLWGMGFYHAVLFVALMSVGRATAAFYTAVTGGAAVAATDLLKLAVDRQRPDDRLVNVSTNSFPSGHVSATAVALVATAFVVGRVWSWILAAAGTVLMMLSRNYLGVHWLSDVVAGALLGTAVAVAFWLLLQNRCVSRNTLSRPPPREASPREQ